MRATAMFQPAEFETIFGGKSRWRAHAHSDTSGLGLNTEFVERKSHDSTSLTNQRLVVTSCHACELFTVDRQADSSIPRQRL